MSVLPAWARCARAALRRSAAAGCALLILGGALTGRAEAIGCAPAANQGASGPSDYQDYCWLDFSGYSDATAQSAGGQAFTFTLPDGSILALTLTVSTNKASPALIATTVPTWTGAAIGHTGFLNIPGSPVLYTHVSGSTVHVALSNISVTPPAGTGASASYAIIAADGESTNSGESLSFTSNGGPWSTVATVAFGGNFPNLAGVGTTTVTETGHTSGDVGAYAFASFNNPTQISSVLVAGGLQGIMFAVRYASIAVNAALNTGGTRAAPSDQFTYSISTSGGTTLATGTSTGSGVGPFTPATVPTVAAGYPFVVTETMAPGSASTLAYYAVSLTCTNSAAGGSTTPLPVNQAVTSYTFSLLQYGDAVSCVFTNTANRANLSVAKTGSATVQAGAAVSYSIVASNAGPLAANGALVTDPAVANFTASAVSCTAATGGAVCPIAPTIASLQGAGIAIPTFPNGGTVTLTVTGTAGTANISNTAAIAAPTAITNSNATPTSTFLTTVTAVADVAAAAAFPATVNAGQPVSGTVTFTNNGPSAAAGTAFTMTLPANLAPAPTLTGLPVGATYSYTASTGVVTLSGMPATLAAAATVGPITINYTQPPAGTSTVTAAVSTTTTDPNLANNSVTVTIAGNPVADVATAAAFPATVNAGQPVSGTVTFTNNGPSTAAGTAFTITLTANLPAAPTLSGLPLGATYSYTASTGVVTLSGMPATLAAAATVGPITINYTQPPAGTSTVTAAVSTTTIDPNPGNNSVTVTVAGNPVADAAAAAAFPATVNAGQPVSGTVTFTNNGPSTAAGTAFTIRLTANLPAAPTLSGLPLGATYSYTASSGVVTLSGMPATLAAAATVGPITINYTQPPAGTSTVTAAVSATTIDPNPGNNSVTVTVSGNPVADLAAAAAFPATVNAGQPVSGTVTFTNNGPSTAAGTAFTLHVAANLAAAPNLSGLPLGATYSYTASSGVVTLTGMPTTMAAASHLGPITIAYTQPGTASSSVVASVTGSTFDPNLANNTATANISGGLAADVAAAAAFPANVNAGQPITGTVTFTNSGPSTAAGTAFTITLAANLPAAPTLNGLPLGASYSYAASTGVVTLTGMPTTLAAGANVGPITINYTQPPAGTSTVTAAVSTTTTDPNPGNNFVTVTIAGNAIADLAAAASFPATVNAGQPVSGTITFTNNGPSTAVGTTFTLNVAANLPAAPTLTGLPVGATYSYTASSGVVTLTGMPATLAAGAKIGPIIVRFTQSPVGTSNVTAAASSSTTDPNLANNTVTVTIAGSAVADVAAAAAFPATVNAGQAVAGTVTFTNIGPSTAAGITFTLTLPANLTVAPSLTGLPAGATYGYTASSGVLALSGMPTTLAASATVGPISIRYTQPPSGASTITAAIAASTMDPNPANNTATATVTGAGDADVSTSGTFPPSVNAGQPVSGTITFSNSGPAAATGTTFTLTLPPNLAVTPTLTLPAGVTYSYNASSGVITLTGMPTTLAAGAKVGPITIRYTQPPTGTSTVSATVNTTSPDPNPANNGTTFTIAGNPVADVAVTAVFPATVNAGQPVSGTVTFSNKGPSLAAGTSFTLLLPANLAAAPTLSGLPPGASYSYNASSGAVTLSGMPTTLASGVDIGPITIGYSQPSNAVSTLTAQVSSSTSDPNPANNKVTIRIAGSANQVTGTVFIDANHSGTFAPGDSPVAGTVVKLLAGARVVATTVTAANGTYSFAGQPPGAYQVAFVPSAGYVADTPATVGIMIGSGGATLVNFGEITVSSEGSLVLSKTTPLMSIAAGQSVPYTITATNPGATALFNATVTDLIPAGFRFRAGSGAVNGRRLDPSVNGRQLSWTGLRFAPGQKQVFSLVLTPGAGVAGGEYVNQASAYSSLNGALISNVATATVRIASDPTFDCPDLIGKVFDDVNANGVEDPGEKGIAGVRLVTAQGLLVTTDADGRYHITCPVIPDPEMGTNFIVKVDERTLPSGYRLTTDNPETVRLTAGKVTKLNFGATIHRVVRIEVSAGAYEGNMLGAAVSARLDTLIGSLVNEAAILRLAYAATEEPAATVDLRLKALHEAVAALWKAKGCRYPLRIEEDIVRSAPRAPARD